MTPDEKEVQRLMGIAQGHARTGLAKPAIQRESHLAFCRLSWKRYAAMLGKTNAECERFAATLERATRDLMVLMKESGDAAAAAGTSEEHESLPIANEEDLGYAYALGYDLITPKAKAAPVAEAATDEAETGESETPAPEQHETERPDAAIPVPTPEAEEPVRYGRPVFVDAGLAPLASSPAKPVPAEPVKAAKPAAPALAEILPKVRDILGKKLHENE